MNLSYEHPAPTIQATNTRRCETRFQRRDMRGKKIPKFKPRRGQIDYTNVQWAPVINCVVTCKGKILIVRRNKKSNFYPGYWNGVPGFLDDKRGLEEKVRDELQEELGISGRSIHKIKLGEIFHQDAPKYKKTWIVHLVLVKVATQKVALDWESENYKWVSLKEVRQYKLLPGFDEVLDKLSIWLR